MYTDMNLYATSRIVWKTFFNIAIETFWPTASVVLFQSGPL